VTTYGYDNMNRLTSISYDTSNAPGVAATNNVTYTYDNNQSSSTLGLLLGITMLSGTQATYTETLSYDSNKRVSSRTWTRDGLSFTTGYQYNTANQLTQLTYPVSLRAVNINHDNKGRLSSIADQYRTYLSNLVFNYAGQVSSQSYGNGVAESFTYNNRLQISTQAASVGGNTRMSLTYDYQAAAGQNGTSTTAGNTGRLMAINNNSTIGGTAESASYTYDLQGRLVTSNQTTNGASAQRRLSYDRWGNRTAVWDAVTGGNQIQSITLQQSGSAPTNRIQSVTTSGGTANYTYDAAGNILSDGLHTYTYDAENRLRSVDWGASNQAAYIYDHSNRRIKKFTNAGVTYYVWEGSEVIGEHSGTGGVIANYVYSGGRMISRLANGVVRYYLSDRLSVRMMLDNSGSVVGRQGHLPYGEEIGTSGEMDKKRFTTYERDSESGLDYAVNRGYSPVVGRFVQGDPVKGTNGAPQSLNRYSYVQNDPINAVDPLGLYQLCLERPGEYGPEYECFEVFEDPGPQKKREVTKCQADMPNDPDGLAAVYTIMHELPGWGWIGRKQTYRKGDTEDNPTGGPYSAGLMQEEAYALANAILNEANANANGSIEAAILNDHYINGKDKEGRQHGAQWWYNTGKEQTLKALKTPDGSAECSRLRRIIRAVNLVIKGNERVLPDARYRWWKATLSYITRQDTPDKHFERIGFHDFMDVPTWLN
jgi:RHS repeat-associated protein